jgi:hypothetical protein
MTQEGQLLAEECALAGFHEHSASLKLVEYMLEILEVVIEGP